MEYTRENILKIINLIPGLDKIGRARLEKSVGELSFNKMPTDIKEFFNSEQKEVIDNPVFLNMMKIFLQGFASGMEDGFGLDLWLDEDGKTNFEVDRLRVRDRLAVKEMLRQQVRATNGNIMCTSTGKVRAVQSTMQPDYIARYDNDDGYVVEEGATWWAIREESFTFPSSTTKVKVDLMAKVSVDSTINIGVVVDNTTIDEQEVDISGASYIKYSVEFDLAADSETHTIDVPIEGLSEDTTIRRVLVSLE